jgi:hypothetical protein
MRFLVYERPCETCVYGPRTPQRPGALAEFEGEALREDSFIHCHTDILWGGYDERRQPPVACRGFWDRHKSDSLIPRLALMLGITEFVPLPAKEKP